MSSCVLFIVLLTLLPYYISAISTCNPNTHFTMNGRLCYCDYRGRWTESNCQVIARRQPCQPGQVIWQGCNHCLCQDSGQLLCTNTNCDDSTITQHGFIELGPRCTPYGSYYVNCSLCFCPASGMTSNAQCVSDSSCSFETHTSDILTLSERNQCIPNVMYLFPCIQCLCSDKGSFIMDKCLEKCQLQIEHKRRCIPGSLYRKECSVCRCPQNSIPDESLCVKGSCGKNKYLYTLRTSLNRCIPQSFTKPICLYCDCSSEGTVNERFCLEIDCAKALDFKNFFKAEVCSPGELIPICIECFCLSNGYIKDLYCTRVCTYQSKLNILENLLNHSLTDHNLIDKSKIKRTKPGEACDVNNLYIDDGRYCLCSDGKNGYFKYCTSFTEKIPKIEKTTKLLKENKGLGSNEDCEPNTLVDIDCNTCYCNRKGEIDPKWCTDDDCEAKRTVKESHKVHPYINPTEDAKGPCIPGSISKIKCNLCICPESGILKDRVCTKNTCLDNMATIYEKFTCEPVAYYEVDCNICFCPQDGLKNVAKCTQNQCGKAFLRSNECIPGNLFSDECNVCLCPPNGNKSDRVCTNHTCGIQPWNTFKLTHSLMENEINEDSTRSLDLCYPGEEFVMGCNLCVCPDLGLKVYATCEAILCDDDIDFRNFSKDDNSRTLDNLENESQFVEHAARNERLKRQIHSECFTVNVSHSAERKECTPGSMYIIRCRECICPYIGNINNFCRALPKNIYCEEAYPGYNYMSMGRRNPANTTSIANWYTVVVSHLKHTKHKCDKPGTIMDECYICQCENSIIIEEHCFKSDAKNCTQAKLNFSHNNKVVNDSNGFYLKIKQYGGFSNSGRSKLLIKLKIKNFSLRLFKNKPESNRTSKLANIVNCVTHTCVNQIYIRLLCQIRIKLNFSVHQIF